MMGSMERKNMEEAHKIMIENVSTIYAPTAIKLLLSYLHGEKWKNICLDKKFLLVVSDCTINVNAQDGCLENFVERVYNSSNPIWGMDEEDSKLLEAPNVEVGTEARHFELSCNIQNEVSNIQCTLEDDLI